MKKKLHIKRRRWTDTKSGENCTKKLETYFLISNDSDFAEFLKKSDDTKTLPLKTIGEMYGIDGQIPDIIKNQLYNLKTGHKIHEDYIWILKLFSNLLSLDEVALSTDNLPPKQQEVENFIVAIIKRTIRKM